MVELDKVISLLEQIRDQLNDISHYSENLDNLISADTLDRRLRDIESKLNDIIRKI